MREMRRGGAREGWGREEQGVLSVSEGMYTKIVCVCVHKMCLSTIYLCVSM